MTSEVEIKLNITTDSLEQFCREIAVGSSNTNRKHAAYMALEAFICRHAGADAHTSQYQAIQDIVSSYSEKTRSQLMSENTECLVAAMTSKDTKTIGRIFSSMSRNGFGQAVTGALEQQESTTVIAIKLWVGEWCSDAREKGEAASGYPDSLDFRNTDIDIIEYTAMAEINTITHNL